MKHFIFYLIIIIIITIILTNIVKSQQITNYYINNDQGNDNGNGTVTNPFKSLCQLNSILNGSTTIPIIINIEYGIYNSTNCTFFLNNINNISIISNNNNNNNYNKNNINNYQNSIIENINIYFYNSNIIINNLIFNFRNESLSIIKSNIVFYNCVLNLNAFDSAFLFYRIWESNAKFINQSKMTNKNNWELNLGESSLLVKDSLFDTILILGSKGGNNISFENSIFIDCYFGVAINSSLTVNNSQIIYNNKNHFNTFTTFSITQSTLTISNCIITSSSTKFGSSQIIYGDTVNPITVSLYNVTISNFVRSSLFSFSIGIIKFQYVKFIECTSSDFFYLSGWNNLYLELNYVFVVTNDYNHFLNLKNTNNNNLSINISNFKTSCSSILIGNTFSKFISTTTTTATASNENYFTTNFNNGSSVNDYPIQISVINSSLDCLGSMKFISSNVLFENVNIEASFESFLFYSKNSNLVLKSTSYVTKKFNNNNKIHGFLFVQESSSNLFLNNCKVENSSSPFLYSIDSYSNIENIKVIQSYSNLQDYFQLSNSSLNIINLLVDYFNTPDSSLIYLYQSNVSISNSTISNSLFGTKATVLGEDSNGIIDHLIITNCFSQSEFFSFSTFIKYLLHNFFISNSLFTDNKGMGINESPFIIASNSIVKLNSCNFIGNSFLPLINSTKSFVTIDDIVFQNNSGSFLFSYYDYITNVTNFILKDCQIPLSFVFGLINTYYESTFNNITISNNYLNQFFFFFSGKPSFDSTGIYNLTFTNNIIILNVDDIYPFTFKTLDNLPISLFIFDGTLFRFQSSTFINNTFNSGLITSFNSTIAFSNCTINENLFSRSPNLLYSNYSTIMFLDCNVCSNYAKNQINSFSPLTIESSGLMSFVNSGLTIDTCQFSNNTFPLSYGGIVYYFINQTNYLNTKKLSIKSSNFSSNIANIGGVFYFSGFMKTTRSYQIFKNKFYNNYGKTSGGVIYNEDYNFPDPKNIYYDNEFLDNFSSFGSNNISNAPSYIKFDENTYGYSDEYLNYEFYVIDILGNQATQVFGAFNTSIVSSDGQSSETFVTSVIYSGIGSFRYTFYSRDYNQFNITIYIDDEPLMSPISVIGCQRYKHYIGDSMNCTYCPVSSTLVYYNGNNESCVQCDSSRMICQDEIFEALDGFYVINKHPQDVLECALDFCLKNNTCQPNERNLGDLCYYCSYGYEQQTHTSLNSAKIGIQCCSKFEPFLLIPIFMIFIIFGLVLSAFKYSMFSNSNRLGSLIIFIQVNSVVFFSYRISLLPLFRLSIDMFDGYCYFYNLNYLQKVMISYCSIILVAIIGYSDIIINSIKTYQWILFNIKKKINPMNDSNVIVIPKFIKTISNRNLKSNGIYKLNSYWSLFQVLFIPLLFNSISLLVYKDIDDHRLSALDFTIYYLNDDYLQIALFTFAIIIIVLISLCLIFLFIINPNVYLIRNNRIVLLSKPIQLSQKINQMILKLNYKNNFKWWDLVILLRSVIFISLSLSMIFSPNYYLLIIIFIQILYQGILIIFKPIKNQKSPIDYKNCLIDIFQLIILIIVGSSLFSNYGSKTKDEN
ncbi:hypothetical protein ACTFIU_010669 [Dictyostelium citrinum]